MSDTSSLLRLLSEKLGMTPAEFDSSTIIIENGEVRVLEEDPEPEAPAPSKKVSSDE